MAQLDLESAPKSEPCRAIAGHWQAVRGVRSRPMGTHPCEARFDLMLKFSIGDDNPHEILLLPLEQDTLDYPPSLLVGIAPVALVQFETAAILPQIGQCPNFHFVDIGAGILASSWLPDNFAG